MNERTLGSKFRDKGRTILVTEGGCPDCVYCVEKEGRQGCGNDHIISGPCLREVRSDGNNVIFKEDDSEQNEG